VCCQPRNSSGEWIHLIKSSELSPLFRFILLKSIHWRENFLSYCNIRKFTWIYNAFHDYILISQVTLPFNSQNLFLSRLSNSNTGSLTINCFEYILHSNWR
jgi:hypothetical protein